MRLIVAILLSASTVTSFGQYEPGYLPEFFFGRQPNARAEAMGKGYTSIDGDLGSIYFNPAGIATIKRIEINTSYTPPEFYTTKGYYTFYGLSYKVHKYLQIALSQFQFNLGKTQVANANKTPYTEKITLTISSEPIKNLLIGLNTNYFIEQPGIDKTSKTLFFDFGVIKKISITSQNRNRQMLNFGASISNVNYATTTATFNNITDKYRLPVITRYGASYVSDFGKIYLFDSVSLVKILVQSEYQVLLNSTYRSGIKFGAEITLLNMLSLRAGWYKEKVYDFGFPNDNKDNIAAFTYGAGVHIPLHLFTKLPIDIQFDFTSLPQVSYSKTYTNWNNFKTYGLRLIYTSVW